MLGNEDGMAAIGRLLAVVGDNGRGKTACDEIRGMFHYDGQTFSTQVGEVFSFQMKAASEI